MKKHLIILGLIVFSLANNAIGDNPKVVVVGAGLSGLACGYRAMENGHDVEVYEARERVGGRVQSVYLKNLDGEYSIVEMGGQNITDGGAATHFLQLCEEFGLDTMEQLVPMQRGHYQNGHVYEYQKLIQDARRDVWKLDKYHEMAQKGISHVSLKEVIDDVYANESLTKTAIVIGIQAYEGGDIDKISISNGLETLRQIMLGGVSSSHKNENGDQLATLHYMSVKGGNSLLAEALAEKLAHRVNLGKTLVSIKETDEQRIQLAFKDGEIVHCDKLVLSIPASVYEDIAIDEKIIDKDRLARLKTVHYGMNSKIMVASNWETSDYISASVGETCVFMYTDMKSVNFYYQGEDSVLLKDNTSQRFWDILKGLSALNKNTQYAAGEPVMVQDKNFGYYNNPVTKIWGIDPYSKGSYSFFGIGADKAFFTIKDHKGTLIKELFEPINDRVYFAGEHTTVIEEIGTMEAAVESGLRMAKLL